MRSRAALSAVRSFRSVYSAGATPLLSGEYSAFTLGVFPFLFIYFCVVLVLFFNGHVKTHGFTQKIQKRKLV